MSTQEGIIREFGGVSYRLVKKPHEAPNTCDGCSFRAWDAGAHKHYCELNDSDIDSTRRGACLTHVGLVWQPDKLELDKDKQLKYCEEKYEVQLAEHQEERCIGCAFEYVDCNDSLWALCEHLTVENDGVSINFKRI